MLYFSAKNTQISHCLKKRVAELKETRTIITVAQFDIKLLGWVGSMRLKRYKKKTIMSMSSMSCLLFCSGVYVIKKKN